MVLRYQDFGPQAAAFELIGYQWYQWLECPCGDSDEHEIKVVVYKGIPLKLVKRKYPVTKGKSDYRYLDYKKAVTYLDSGISFNNQEKAASLKEGDSTFASMSEGLVERYQKTRAEIVKGVCRE